MSNAPSPSTTPGGFLLCACQGGAEAALKARAAGKSLNAYCAEKLATL